MPRGQSAGSPELFSKVIDDFQDSEFDRYAPSTQRWMRRVLGYAAGVLGNIPATEVDPAYVQAFLNGLRDRTGVQEQARKALHMLEAWAVLQRRLPRSITLGTKVVGSDGAREPWTEAEVALAVEHSPPAIARAVLLGASTGQRLGDLVRMRWGDLRTERGRLGIAVTQQKTGKALWCPIIHEFEPILMSWERDSLWLLHKPTGEPWARQQLTEAWYRERLRNRALEALNAKKLSLHGLRATAVIRLRRDGLENNLIGRVVGMSEPMVNRYCRHAEQVEDAIRAMQIREEHAANKLTFLHRTKDDKGQ